MAAHASGSLIDESKELLRPTLGGLEYFDALSKMEGRRFSSLDSAKTLFAALGNPQDNVASIHVAGTNGKGTVSALISAMLLAEGKTVGQTCSPHLTEICERCLVNGAPHDTEQFCLAIEKVVEASFAAEICPSYFVLGLAACYLEFARLNLDNMVIEVGLGGKLDATNLMTKSRASVITNISFDHTELLGNTLGEIAQKKAGIFRSGVPAFVGAVEPEARQAIVEEAAAIGATVEFFGENFTYDEASSELRCSDGNIRLELKSLSLRGAHQKRNAILAARVALSLGVSEKSINDGLRRVRWPGRLEFFPARPHDVLFDVAHNPGGIDAMVESLPELLQQGEYQRLTFVLSVLDRKDWRTMFTKLEAACRSFEQNLGIEVNWIFTTSEHAHAVAPEELLAYFPSGRTIEVPEEALAAACAAGGPKTLVFVTGSVFLVGRLRPAVTAEPFRSFI